MSDHEVANISRRDFSTASPDVYRFPFPAFPNGWFPVALSNEVACGAVVPIHRLGEDMVVYRTESGVANVIAAYCPHLGAHIGFGGTVIGERIQCPFHHWQFTLDGKCASTARPPNNSKQSVSKRFVVERNGAIFIWNDAQGREPSWEIPFIPEAEPVDYIFKMGKVYDFLSHPQEPFENQPDEAHFATLHGWRADMRWDCDLKSPVTTLSIWLNASDDRDIRDGEQPDISTMSVGPSSNYSSVRNPLKGIASLQFCPTSAGNLRAWVYFTHEPEANQDTVDVWIASYLAEFEKDIKIWAKKRYVQSPPLIVGDGQILKMRQWYSQWYR